MTMRRNHPLSDHQLSDPERWVDEHGDALYRYARLRLRSRELAEDIVQETFLAALHSRHRFAGQSSERTWLIGILKHKIIDHFRKTSREHLVDDLEPLAHQEEVAFNTTGKWIGHWRDEQGPGQWATGADSLPEQLEFWDALHRGLSTLSPRLAQVFMLREMDQLSTDDICRMLDISQSNLWVMLHRARMHLRRYLETNYFGQPSEHDQRADRTVCFS